MESAGVGELFRVSSYSSNGGGNCVELGQGAGAVLVRDTRDRSGGSLRFSPRTWTAFTTSLRDS